MIPCRRCSPAGEATWRIYFLVGGQPFMLADLPPEDRRALRYKMHGLHSQGILKRVASPTHKTTSVWKLTDLAVKRARDWEAEGASCGEGEKI